MSAYYLKAHWQDTLAELIHGSIQLLSIYNRGVGEKHQHGCMCSNLTHFRRFSRAIRYIGVMYSTLPQTSTM